MNLSSGFGRTLLAAVVASCLSVPALSGCGSPQAADVPTETSETVALDADDTSPADAKSSEEPAEGSDGASETAAQDAGGEVAAGGAAEEATVRQGGATVLDKPYDEGYSSGKHHAVIKVEKLGEIRLELDADVAPISVSNFAHLAKAGFYDSLTFHRIIDGFMVQGGDPLGDGTGGSDTQVKGEFASNGVDNGISHVRGVISMARASNPDSGSSQFFIVQADSTFLDGEYAAFGKVTEGMDVVDEIAKTEVLDDNGTVAPGKQPRIESVKMVD